MNTNDKKLTHNSLMQIVKDKLEENEKLKQTVEEQKVRAIKCGYSYEKI